VKILRTPLIASASGMDVNIPSTLTTQSGIIAAATALPIDITITKNDVTENISDIGITTIILNYAYNTDLLTLRGSGKIIDAYIPANGWTADNASVIDDKKGILKLILHNSSPLSDAVSSLGELRFFSTVNARGKSTSFMLQSAEFLAANDSLIGNCIDVTSKPSEYELSYSCGDSSLAEFMRTGNLPMMVRQVNPNPVSKSSSGVIRFEYATRIPGNISISLYDELGRESARVIGSRYHQAGSYEIKYDTQKLLSGSYIFRCTLDNSQVISGKIIISN
jgi:hypothetical protein